MKIKVMIFKGEHGVRGLGAELVVPTSSCIAN